VIASPDGFADTVFMLGAAFGMSGRTLRGSNGAPDAALSAVDTVPMPIERAITFNVEAAHLSPSDPRLHGHSYLVKVWTDATNPADFHAIQGAVEPIHKTLDHSYLNDSMGGTTMEHMAEWVLNRLPGLPVTRVQVIRPTLGFEVEARP
jgi:hypothetical protein